MKVLMSIKPKYADKIFSGEKCWEYRKKIWVDRKIKTVVVYASAPTSMVIGEFAIGNIVYDHPYELWEFTKNFSGINHGMFLEYFKKHAKGYALGIFTAELYVIPKPLSDYGLTRPPQNFMYLDY